MTLIKTSATTLVSLAFLAAFSGLASATTLLDRYDDALNMDEVYDVLRDEGIAAGEKMPREDRDFSPSPAWTKRLEVIYRIDKMEVAFREGLTSVGDLEGSEDALAFFESDLGKKIIRIELDARRALQDESVEAATREKIEAMEEDAPERLKLYEDFIDANDLINGNVAGALNSNIAFYRGMATSPNFEDVMTEAFMLEQAWGQEPEIRDEMTDWSRNFTALAYDTLDADEMQAYIDMSKTKPGQKMNTALFAGFDKVFSMQSYELGRASAEFMMGDDT